MPAVSEGTMNRHSNEAGSALILVLCIMAIVTMLAMTLAFVLMNQMKATASDRATKQSVYAAEAALDSAVQEAKTSHTMSTTAEWLTPADLAQAFAGTEFPEGAEVTYRVYDTSPRSTTVSSGTRAAPPPQPLQTAWSGWRPR
jgi:Tfp pilus assembly protein PilX